MKLLNILTYKTKHLKFKTMGRSVDYLNKAINIVYFQWPLIESYNDETGQYEQTDEYEESYIIKESIQESIISQYPKFNYSKKYDGNETAIILTGYGVEIGLSEYCGLAALSIRIDENSFDCYYSEDEYNQQYDNIETWINENWPKISLGYNQYNRIGSFSNGESVYQISNK